MKLNLTFEPDAKLLVSHRTWYRVNLFQLVQEHFGLRIVFLQKLDYRLMLDDKEERYDSEQLQYDRDTEDNAPILIINHILLITFITDVDWDQQAK